MAKIKATTVDISNGIPAQEMIELLRQKEPLVLNGNDNRIEIGENEVLVIDRNRTLQKEQIPSKIKGQEVTGLQQDLPVKGQEVSVGDLAVRQNGGKTGLDVERNEQQPKLKNDENAVRVSDEKQVLKKEGIPSEIEGQKVTDLQKDLLMKGKEISVGDVSVRLNEEKTGLDIERNEQVQQLKIGG